MWKLVTWIVYTIGVWVCYGSARWLLSYFTINSGDAIALSFLAALSSMFTHYMWDKLEYRKKKSN